MCESNFEYTPKQVVADLEAIGIFGINPDFVTIVTAKEETDEASGTSQMILVEVEQPFETVEDLRAWGEASNQIDRSNPALAPFFHNEWHGLVNKEDPSDIKLVGKVAYILGDNAVDIAREMFQLTHDPLEALLQSMVSGAGLGNRGSVDAELAALLGMLQGE